MAETKVKPSRPGPDYMGHVPGRPNIWVMGGDMVSRGFGWADFFSTAQPSWRTWKLSTRNWGIDKAALEFDAVAAKAPAADMVVLSFGELECSDAWMEGRAPGDFAEHLKELVRKIREHEKTKTAAIAFVTPFPVQAGRLGKQADAYKTAGPDKGSRTFAETFRAVGKETGIPVVDLHGWVLEYTDGKPVDDLRKTGFLADNGYGTSPLGGALCARYVADGLAEAATLKSGNADAYRRLVQYETQYGALERVLAETCAGMPRTCDALEPIPMPDQPSIRHFGDEARFRLPVDALQDRRWLTVALQATDAGYVAVCAARTDSPYEPKVEVTFEDGTKDAFSLPGYGHWGAIREETPDLPVKWDLTSLNYGKNRLRPVTGGPIGKRRITLMSFDVFKAAGRKVADAALYLRYANIDQGRLYQPECSGVHAALVEGRDAWVAHGGATWRTRDGRSRWTGGDVDAAKRRAGLNALLKQELLPEIRRVAQAELAALDKKTLSRVPRPLPQLPAGEPEPDTVLPPPAWAKAPLRRVFLTPARLAVIRTQVKVKGSHHQQALHILKTNVDNPDFAAAYGGAGYASGYKSVETALLSAVSESEADRKKYGDLAYKTMLHWTSTGSATLGKSMQAYCLSLTYNWAYPAWTTDQRVAMRELVDSVLRSLGQIKHSNLGADRTSNFVGVIRGAELLLWLCSGEDVKSERCRFLIGELKQYFDNAFGDLGVCQEGPGYTEYPFPFAFAAAVAAEECGDATLMDAVRKHDFCRLLCYTRMGGSRCCLFSPWGVSGSLGSGSGMASQLLHLCSPEDLPHYVWWYDRTMGRLTPRSMVERFDGHRHGKVWALVFYPAPDRVIGKDPMDTFPPAVADSRGYFFFRNHWRESGGIMASLIAQVHKDQKGWNQPEQLAISLQAHDQPFIVGPDKDNKPSSYSALLVDGKYTYKDATSEMGKVLAFEPGRNGGYAIAQGGEMYEKLGVREAKRHMRVEFLPKDTALISTLDEIRSAGEHTYTWQANLGAGIKVESGTESDRPFFLMKGANGHVKGWVLHPADASIKTGDPLQISTKSKDAKIWVVMHAAPGKKPAKATVAGEGMQSVLKIGGKTVRFDGARITTKK